MESKTPNNGDQVGDSVVIRDLGSGGAEPSHPYTVLEGKLVMQRPPSHNISAVQLTAQNVTTNSAVRGTGRGSSCAQGSREPLCQSSSSSASPSPSTTWASVWSAAEATCNAIVGVMRFRKWLACFALVGATGACGDDDPASASGAAGDTGTAGDTDTAGDGSSGDAATGNTTPTDTEDSSDETDTGPTGCGESTDCDDGDPCTDDLCTDGTCENPSTAIVVECRPAIDVEFPPRGATIAAKSAEGTVIVVGTVQSPVGEITTFTINGGPVSVDDEGAFSYDLSPGVGGNTLTLETEDSTGQTRRRVQSFLWGTQWAKPTEPVEGMAPQGMAIYFSDEGLDDGDHSQPYNDLASILGLAITAIDIGSFFASDTALASSAGYDIYLTSLDYDTSDVGLTAIDGGLALTASIFDIEGELDFDCTNVGCFFLGGDGTGGLTIDELAVTADVLLSVNQESHELDVELVNVNTMLSDVDIFSNNIWTNFLLGIVEGAIIGGVVGDLEDELDAQLADVLTPLLAEGLQSFTFSTSLDLPNLGNPDEAITIDLITDFGLTDFHDGVAPPEPSPPEGGAIILRGGGFADGMPAYEGLGFPLRNGCEVDEAGVNLVRESRMEIALHDDLINEILYGAWKGGLLEFPLPPELVGESALFSDLVVDVSGMLPPVGVDCNETGELLAHIGDIRIDASLILGNAPVSFTAFTTAVVKIDITATDGQIGISLAGLQEVHTELNVNEGAAITAEPVLIGVLESALIDGLIGGLGGDALGGIELPEIDLSESLGLPPGTATIAIQVDEVVRQPGTTVILGSL